MLLPHTPTPRGACQDLKDLRGVPDSVQKPQSTGLAHSVGQCQTGSGPKLPFGLGQRHALSLAAWGEGGVLVGGEVAGQADIRTLQHPGGILSPSNSHPS